MHSLSKFIPMAMSFLLLTICLAASAKADTIENLDFTGTATCNTGFVFQECSAGSGGLVTGNYSLDVTTQTIVGAWSFTTPYGVLSSNMIGASTFVSQLTLVNGLDDEASFEILTNSPKFLEVLSLVWAHPNPTEIGAIFSPAFPFAGSGMCQNIPGQSGPSCEPDVSLTGMTALAPSPTPEPGTSSLMLIGIGLLLVMRKRIAQGLPLAT
jgi:hypothetical protein